jgi:threonine aldolase
MNAPLGDDVMGEDPTINEFEAYMADLFGKEKGLFLPTASMSNLVALLAHCNTRASEIIIGTESHINLWEGGNPANVGGIHTRQTPEDVNAQLSEQNILDCFRNGVDDHWPHTALLCLENSHNMCGGVALPKSYFDRIGRLAHETMKIPVHVDGARIFNAAVAQGTAVKDLCEHVDSVTICLSKGLGAPVGSILVGAEEVIRLAKRARKRVGGGMRQAGVMAAMGMFAVQHNVERLAEDHERAKKLGRVLKDNGFYLLRDGQIDTNIVYFGLPESCSLSKGEFLSILSSQYGVKVTGGYSSGGRLFRAVSHMHIDDAHMDRAIEGIVALGCS